MPDHSNYFSADQDPYFDHSSGVLKNIPNLKTDEELKKFEELMFQASSIEVSDYLKSCSEITLYEWRKVHSMCFADIYEWAGELRTIRVAKGSTVFAYPENIIGEADKIFDEINILLKDAKLTLEKIAELFTEANVLHPFREGNGRTQRILFREVMRRAGYSVDYSLTDQTKMINAMVHGYNANYAPVITLFKFISTKTG